MTCLGCFFSGTPGNGKKLGGPTVSMPASTGDKNTGRLQIIQNALEGHTESLCEPDPAWGRKFGTPCSIGFTIANHEYSSTSY